MVRMFPIQAGQADLVPQNPHKCQVGIADHSDIVTQTSV